jgi:cysteine synthase
VAVDSVRIQLERSGFTEQQLQPATIQECRQVTAKEATDIIVEHARKEGD